MNVEKGLKRLGLVVGGGWFALIFAISLGPGKGLVGFGVGIAGFLFVQLVVYLVLWVMSGFRDDDGSE